jgi:hypothetical protein
MVAAKSIGEPRIRTEKVAIKITKSERLSGEVKSTGCTFFYEGFLERSGYDEDGRWKNQKPIYSDGGVMFLRLREKTAYLEDPISHAEEIYGLMCHEWKHIADMQQNKVFSQFSKRWGNRPHEIRAVMAKKIGLDRASESLKVQDAILALAIELEEICNR